MKSFFLKLFFRRRFNYFDAFGIALAIALSDQFQTLFLEITVFFVLLVLSAILSGIGEAYLSRE